MPVSLFPQQMPEWLDQTLNRVEQLVWDDNKALDTTTPSFYVYKVYPSSIKGAQLDDWVSLQAKALSPFAQGDVFYYRAAKGVCLWAAKTPFTGVPETAAQQSLANGEYLIQGVKFTYRQKWHEGVMVHCEIIPTVSESAASIQIPQATAEQPAWAKRRQVDLWLQKPIFWSALLGLIAMTFWIWIGTGLATQAVQSHQLESTLTQIEQELGDKLVQRERYQDALRLVDSVEQWHNELGNLPKSLALVVDKVIAGNKWVAEALVWQQNKLQITLIAQELDIASLVSELENTNEFSSVSIRPHNRANFWVLEVVSRD